ncbi:MAG: hypothetical protein ACXVH2_05260 [Methanobacterium sp.]
MSDKEKYHLTLIILALIIFSAFGYYIGTRNQAPSATNITNQSSVPDFFNFANSGKGIQSSGGTTKPTNKTNNTKNKTV